MRSPSRSLPWAPATPMQALRVCGCYLLAIMHAVVQSWLQNTALEARSSHFAISMQSLSWCMIHGKALLRVHVALSSDAAPEKRVDSAALPWLST